MVNRFANLHVPSFPQALRLETEACHDVQDGDNVCIGETPPESLVLIHR